MSRDIIPQVRRDHCLLGGHYVEASRISACPSVGQGHASALSTGASRSRGRPPSSQVGRLSAKAAPVWIRVGHLGNVPDESWPALLAGRAGHPCRRQARSAHAADRRRRLQAAFADGRTLNTVWLASVDRRPRYESESATFGACRLGHGPPLCQEGPCIPISFRLFACRVLLREQLLGVDAVARHLPCQNTGPTLMRSATTA